MSSRIPRRRTILRAGAAISVAATVFLTGCYSAGDYASTQLDVTGDANVSVALCAPALPVVSSRVTAADCPTGTAEAFKYDAQLFVAFAVPDAFPAPASVHADGDFAGLAFTRSPAYEAAIQQPEAIPAPAGYHWVGYASSLAARLPSREITGPLTTISARFPVVDPAVTSFGATTVTGWRWVRPATPGNDDAWPIDRPITCGTAQMSSDSTSQTNCLQTQSPTPISLPSDPNDPESGPSSHYEPATAALNTLQFAAPAAATTVVPGATAKLSFAVTSHRATKDALTLPLTVEGSVPGASIVAPTNVALGTDQSLDITVAVPATTATGDYTVNVTAGTGSGKRTATATVHVQAPAPVILATTPDLATQLLQSAQALSADLGTPDAAKALRQGAATVGLSMPVRGFVRASVLGVAKKGKKAPVLAVGTAETDRGQVIKLTLKATKLGKVLLARHKTIRGTLVLRLWGRSGKTVTSPVSLNLR